MKIAMTIFRYFPHGGLQRDFLRIAEACAGRGHQITCFAGEWEGERPSLFSVDVIPLRAWSNHGRAAEFERKALRRIGEGGFDRTIGFNRMKGLDLYFAADNCLALSARAKHSPLALALNPRYRIFLRLEREVFDPRGERPLVMHITPRQKEEFRSAYDTPEERFRLLPPGVDERCRNYPADAAAIRRRVREALGVAEGEWLLLLVGSNLDGKGGDRLLRAVGALPLPLRERCRIVFAGKGATAGCVPLSHELGLAARTCFLGGRDDIPELLLAADLMVHPARNESAGAVLLEALAFGLPVIASGECGFSPIVAEAGNFALARPFNQTELNEVLERLLADPEALKALRARTLNYGRKADFYSRAAVAAELIETVGGGRKP